MDIRWTCGQVCSVFYCVPLPFVVPSPNCVAPPTNITPTELDPSNIPVCCAGVLLSDDPSIQVQVLVDGTLHPANQVVRSGSFLYTMGLQAGTEYSLRIALTNIFGTEWVNTTVRPLLGELVHVNSNVHLNMFLILPLRPSLHPTSDPHPHYW